MPEDIWSSTSPGNTSAARMGEFQSRYSPWGSAAVGTAMTAVILCTVVGNIFVVVAIFVEKNLQSTSNYLLVSLAIADLTVAILVMPVCALNQLSVTWWLGEHLCDLWICLDVLCCTASILHLVGIALDRYWAVTSVRYVRSRSASRIGLVICLTWIISAVISVPARFYPSRKNPTDGNATDIDQCRINEEPGYTVFSTVGAFYLPMLFMLAIYVAIYKAVKRRIRKKEFMQLAAPSRAPRGGSGGINARRSALLLNTSSGLRKTASTSPTSTATTNNTPEASSISAQHGTPPALLTVDTVFTGLPKECHNCLKRERLAQARERRAARTLAVVTGCFLVCWLPFFTHAAVCPFNKALCQRVVSDVGHSVIQWLGYLNSTLNPVIYTVFSPDFRGAFSRILFGKRNGQATRRC